MAKKPKHYTPEERTTLLEAINQERKNGLSIAEACAAHNVNESSYWNWQQGRTKNTTSKVGKRPYRKRATELVSLPLPTPGNLMIIWGTPNDINAALEKVSRIQNA